MGDGEQRWQAEAAGFCNQRLKLTDPLHKPDCNTTLTILFTLLKITSRRLSSIPTINSVRIEKSRLSFFYFFLLIFILFLIYFSLLLFLELRVRVNLQNTRRKAWENDDIQHIQHMLTLRCIHSSLE